MEYRRCQGKRGAYRSVIVLDSSGYFPHLLTHLLTFSTTACCVPFLPFSDKPVRTCVHTLFLALFPRMSLAIYSVSSHPSMLSTPAPSYFFLSLVSSILCPRLWMTLPLVNSSKDSPFFREIPIHWGLLESAGNSTYYLCWPMALGGPSLSPWLDPLILTLPLCLNPIVLGVCILWTLSSQCQVQ